MTKRPLILVLSTAAMLLLLYVAFVQVVPLTITVAQNQNDNNLIRVQDYLRDPDRALVLAGSSLTFRLQPAVLGPQTANLGLAGDGARTGLALIRDAGARPRRVLVETNLLLHPANMELVHGELRFPDRDIRRVLRAFRTGYDPINLLWRGLAAIRHKSDIEPPLPPAVTHDLVARQRQEKSSRPDPDQLRRSLRDTRTLVASLRARGIVVGFLEMPIDPGLENSRFDTELRSQILLAFPEDRNCWVRPQVPGGAHTVDGIHLTQNDAALVAARIGRLAERCS